MLIESDDEDSDDLKLDDSESDCLDAELEEAAKSELTPAIAPLELGKFRNDAFKKLDDPNKDKFFAFLYKSPKTYYWAQLKHVFCHDSDADADEVEVIFLKRVNNTSDPSTLLWDWQSIKEMERVDAQRCFYGPCVPEVTKISATSRRSGFRFECETEVRNCFAELKKKGLLF